MDTLVIVFVAAVAIVAIALLARSYRDDHLQVRARKLAEGAGLSLAPEHLELLKETAGRLERGSLFGGLAGLVIAVVLSFIPPGIPLILIVGFVLAGAGVGMAVGALRSAASPPSDAVLVARSRSVSLADYSPGVDRYGTRGLVAVSVAITAAVVAAYGFDALPVTGLTLCTAAVVTLGGFEFFGRRIVDKGRPAGSVIELVLDDALRATYVRNLTPAPLVLAAFAIFVAVDAYSVNIGIDYSSTFGVAVFPVVILGSALARFVTRDRPASQHYLRRLWPELAAGGPGSSAVVEEPNH